MNRGGDRFGGVVFDIQQYRKGEYHGGTPTRRLLIIAASSLIQAIERIDDEELHRCNDAGHNRYGQRRSDCRECMGVLATTADVDDIVAKRERAQGESTDSTHTCVCSGRRGQPGSHCLTCQGVCDGVQR